MSRVDIPFNCSHASGRVIVSSFLSDSQVTRPFGAVNDTRATIMVGPNAISTATVWRAVNATAGVYWLQLSQSECSAQGVPGQAMLWTSRAGIGSHYIPLFFPLVDSFVTPSTGSGATAGEIWTHAVRSLTSAVASTSTPVAPSAADIWASPVRSLTSAITASNFTGVAVASNFTGVAVASNFTSHVTALNMVQAAPTAAQIWANPVRSLTSSVVASNVVAPPTEAEIADAILDRNLAGGSDGGRTVRDALRSARNLTSIQSGVMTVYQEDDLTPAWTAAVSTSSDQEPITGVDPQ
jgi:hypothetical protein